MKVAFALLLILSLAAAAVKDPKNKKTKSGKNKTKGIKQKSKLAKSKGKLPEESEPTCSDIGGGDWFAAAENINCAGGIFCANPDQNCNFACREAGAEFCSPDEDIESCCKECPCCLECPERIRQGCPVLECECDQGCCATISCDSPCAELGDGNWVVQQRNANCVGGLFCVNPDPQCESAFSCSANDKCPPGQDIKTCCEDCPCCEECPEPKPPECFYDDCSCESPECCETLFCRPGLDCSGLGDGDWVAYENISFNCGAGYFCASPDVDCIIGCEDPPLLKSCATNKDIEICCEECPCCEDCPEPKPLECFDITCRCNPPECCDTLCPPLFNPLRGCFVRRGRLVCT